jgi:hypothetical protein
VAIGVDGLQEDAVTWYVVALYHRSGFNIFPVNLRRARFRLELLAMTAKKNVYEISSLVQARGALVKVNVRELHSQLRLGHTCEVLLTSMTAGMMIPVGEKNKSSLTRESSP